MATALAGLGLLVVLTLQPQPGATSFGLLFPPWVSRADAISRSAALELPIIDIRLGGRLIVLNAALGARAGSGGLAQGALIINPVVAALCIDAFLPEEPAT